MNHTLMKIMSTHVASNQKDWAKYLKPALMTYRVTPHQATGFSPFYLLYGRHPILNIHAAICPRNEASASLHFHLEKTIENLQDAQKRAQINIQRAQQRAKNYHDKTLRIQSYTPGSRVWVYNPTIKPGLSRKLQSKWFGPFNVIKKVGEVNFQVGTENKILPSLIHHNRLKPYIDRNTIPHDSPKEVDERPTIPRKLLPPEYSEPLVKPALDTSDDLENTFQAEKILGKKFINGKPYFRIKWFGWSSKHNSWEPAEHLTHEFIEDYEKKQLAQGESEPIKVVLEVEILIFWSRP